MKLRCPLPNSTVVPYEGLKGVVSVYLPGELVARVITYTNGGIFSQKKATTRNAAERSSTKQHAERLTVIRYNVSEKYSDDPVCGYRYVACWRNGGCTEWL